MDIHWPMEKLKPQDVSVDINHRSLRGPSASNGFTQVVSNSAGIWRVTYSGIPVYDTSRIRLWRALDTLTEGQLNPIVIPIYDHPRSPGGFGELGKNIYYGMKATFSDGGIFDDLSCFQGGYMNAKAISSAATGTVTISMSKDVPATIEPGHRFSVNNCLYQVKSIISQTNSQASFIVRPPLRQPIQIGDYLDFDFPKIRVRLASDSEMSLPLDYNRNSFPNISFIEDL